MTTFAHREADRVPVDYLANREIDVALKRHYGLADDDSEGLAEKLGVDFRGCYVTYTAPALHGAPQGIHVNEWGARTRWVEHPTGGYWDFCDFPMSGVLTKERVDAWPMPSPDDYDFSGIEPYCDAHADYPIVVGGAGVGCIINRIGQFRGMQDTLCDVVTEDPAGLRLIDRMLEIDFEVARRALAAAGRKAQIFCMGEDLGTQRAPIIGPETYRRVIKPRHQRYIEEAKKHGLLVMFHCCGSSSWAFDDMAHMGVDIIDTLQPEAADMEPARLKQQYGHKLCFHGMISTAGVLAFGTAQQVRDEVKRTLDIMMPGGGYALCPTHMIQSNSPVENVVTMYETAREYGVY
jgi:uroporphyrinogen decarboxylase